MTQTTGYFCIFSGRNEVVANVMFLLVSVILSTGGGGGEFCPIACWDIPPGPRADTPPRPKVDTPRGPKIDTPLPHNQKQTPPGPKADTPPRPKAEPPPPLMSSRYASYWNAYFVLNFFWLLAKYMNCIEKIQIWSLQAPCLEH